MPWAWASARHSTGPLLQGVTGICTCSAIRLEAILSPTRRITSPSGPMNTMPSSRQRSANAACSATKPHPAQRASDAAIVDVTALELLGVWIEDLRGAETHCLVRLTHKHAPTVRLREKRDRAQ